MLLHGKPDTERTGKMLWAQTATGSKAHVLKSAVYFPSRLRHGGGLLPLATGYLGHQHPAVDISNNTKSNTSSNNHSKASTADSRQQPESDATRPRDLPSIAQPRWIPNKA
jgi:hypothetical protein